MSAVARFRDAVAARFGLQFDDDKLPQLAAILERRAEAGGVGIEYYLAERISQQIEMAALGAELTVGETYFFRNFEQFAALRDRVLPERLEAAGEGGQLRLLSAGCSSGEEPFSLAMLTRSLEPRVSIRAVDLNPLALERAATGRYGQWSLRETPPDMLEHWFNARGREVELDPLIRAAVQFQCANLADAACPIWGEGPYDVIFCRNVIMYFTPQVQCAVVSRLAKSLAPGGYLFLGHAETLRGLSQDFHLVHTHGTFYYQRRDAIGVQPEVSTPQMRTRSPVSVPSPLDFSWFEAIGRASRRIESLASPEMRERQSPRTTTSDRPGVTDILQLLSQEHFAEALARLDGLPAAAGIDPDILVLRAVLLAQSGNCAAASVICRALIAREEHHAGANYVLGLCFEEAGNPGSALLHYDLAAHIDPLFAMPHLRRGLLARRAGRRANANADLSKALELLAAEDSSRLLLFGGGFTRAALIKLCQAELRASEAAA